MPAPQNPAAPSPASPATAASRRSRRFRALLAGGHPALPGPLDALAERWAALLPRARALTIVAAVVLLLVASGARIRAAESRWGGTPISALVAVRDLPVGAAPHDLRRVRLPPDALPVEPLSAVPEGAVLALALPAGAVLTAAHVDPTGPAVGLADDLRALPIPIDEAWGVTAGAWVDVHVLRPDGTAELAGRSRPVLELRGDGSDASALIGLAVHEVSTVTAALGQGRVLLAHAPPP